MATDKNMEAFDPMAWASLNNVQGSALQAQAGGDASNPAASPASMQPVNDRFAVLASSHDDTDSEQISSIVNLLVNRGIDITSGYGNWLNLGFALADGLGEDGRTYYHDLSRMNGDYNAVECDKQYNACLRSHGNGVTIKSFFQMAKDAGIDISEVAREAARKCANCADAQPCASKVKEGNSLILNNGYSDEQPCANAQTAQKSDGDELNLSFHQTFSDKIPEEDWCKYFTPVLASMEDAEGKDKMILGTLVENSGFLPNYYGIYSQHTVYPPLYILFYGPSASRKGEIASCQYITKPLKDEIVGQYHQELDEYKMAHSVWESKGGKAADKATRGEEPKEPEYRSPIIPANSSASAAYLALKANGGWGVMFETEAAVLTQSLLSDYGDYSSGLLAAFHHEPIKMNRVKDKIRFEIDEPCLAIGLTCTPGQLPKLFPTFEDGLGNRFLYYGLNRKLAWINPFKKIEKPLNEVYEDLGKESLELYHLMKQLGNRRIQFLLKEEQIEQFNTFFSDLLMEQFAMLGDGITSFIFRLGLSTFRIAMVLTLLRRYSDREEGKPLFADNEQAILCGDKDFNIALTIMNTLVNHTATIYSALAKDDERFTKKELAELSQPERTLYDALGEEFDTKSINETAGRLHMNPDTVRRYVGNYVNKYHIAERVKNGQYRKVSRK